MTETRSDKKAYQKWEFTEKQQRYLLEYISQPGIKAKIILCGYSTSFYDRRLLKYNREKGCHWQKVHILQAGSVSRGAREYLWVNFDFSVLEKQFPEFFKIVPESDWEIKYRKKG
jgi:site-specific DNA-adenine methylase